MKRLLSTWSWRLDRPDYIPLFLSLFGDWFLRDNRGLVYMLDLVAGQIKLIADSETEFMANLEDEEYQREWLMAHLASALSGADVVRTDTQCFAFRTPPMLGGTLSPDNVLSWDLEAYQNGTSKVHQQVAGLEPGTGVVIKSG